MKLDNDDPPLTEEELVAEEELDHPDALISSDDSESELSEAIGGYWS